MSDFITDEELAAEMAVTRPSHFKEIYADADDDNALLRSMQEYRVGVINTLGISDDPKLLSLALKAASDVSKQIFDKKRIALETSGSEAAIELAKQVIAGVVKTAHDDIKLKEINGLETAIEVEFDETCLPDITFDQKTLVKGSPYLDIKTFEQEVGVSLSSESQIADSDDFYMPETEA